MTTLSIIANYEKKRLKCYGMVAAGEHVAVTVTDGAQWIGEGKSLRLRVLFGPNIVAVFPFAEGDAWTASGTQDADAACELNLNTLQAEKYLKHGGTCLWILDDVENHTLYATGEFDVLPWPKRRGIDEPIDLDGYPQLVDDINELKEAWEEYKQTIEQAIAAKQDIINDLPEIREGAGAGATAIQPDDILDGDKVKSDLLPSYVDDVLEYATFSAFPATGESGKIYIALDTNKTYRWSGTQYTEIANPNLDSDVTKNSANGVKSSGIWKAIWGALASIPVGFTSMYDWVKNYFASPAAIAPRFDLEETYTIGDICVEAGVYGASGLLYRCKKGYTTTSESDYPSEDPEHWEEVDVNTLLAGKKNNFDAGNGLVETSNTLYAYKGVAGTTTEGETRYTIGPADVGSTVYSWDGSAATPTGKTVRMVSTSIGRIYTEPFPSTVYYDRSAADDIVRPNVIAIDKTVVAVKTDIPAPSTATPAMDGTAAPGTSAAYARGDHVHPTDTSRMAATATGANIAVSDTDATKIDAALAGKATKDDATLTARFSAWTLSGDVEAGSQYEVRFDYDYDGTTLWALYEDGASYPLSTGSDNPLSTSEDFPYGETTSEYTITATRTALSGYQLGSQTSKPLASEAEAEALRTGKQNALTAQQLANIAAVSNALAFDATRSYAAGDPVVYNGTLYTFTAAHTGAWTGSDVSAVDIIARLAGKLDKSGGTMTGALHIHYGLLYVENATGDAQYIVNWMSAIDAWALKIKPENSNTPYFIIFPNTGGTLALTAGTGHTGNLAALDANGNPTDAGYHFEVRNGIPCIVQYT